MLGKLEWCRALRPVTGRARAGADARNLKELECWPRLLPSLIDGFRLCGPAAGPVPRPALKPFMNHHDGRTCQVTEFKPELPARHTRECQSPGIRDNQAVNPGLGLAINLIIADTHSYISSWHHR